MRLILGLVLVAACIATPVPGISLEEGELFQGDMILTAEQLKDIEKSSKLHSYAAIKDHLWVKDGKAETIKYYVDPKIREAAHVIEYAITGYHANTCIRFQRVTSKPKGPHIYFTDGHGCSSSVGKRSKCNTIHLARGCWHKGTIQHEIGHTLGFHHEQSRPDRDKYVTILWQNIKKGHEHNFIKYGYDRIDSRGFKYDLDSMMHYGSKFFSKDRKHLLTIKTRDPQIQGRIGQRNGMSPGDIAQLRKMYFC